MATSKHFLEQVQTGDVAAALQAALENAGSLKIVTHIAGAGAANDLPDSQKIYTCIDAVAGTIETSVGEKFVQDGNFKVLCEGHMQQVVAGCSSVRDNLDTIQALLDWVSDEPRVGSAAAGQSSGTANDNGMAAGEAPNGVAIGEAGMGEMAADASTFAATAAVGAVAAGVGAAAVSNTSSEDDMLELMEQPTDDSAEAFDAGEGALFDDLGGEGEAPVGELELGVALSLEDDAAPGSDAALEGGTDLAAENGLDGNDALEGDLGFGTELGLGDDLGLGDEAGLSDDGLGLDLDTAATESQNDDLGFDLGDSSAEVEDAGPETEFLTAEAEDNTQLFGSETEALELASPEIQGEPLGESLTEDLGGGDFGSDLGEIDLGGADLGAVDLGGADSDGADLAAPDSEISLADAGSDDPLAGLELGSELGGETNGDDPFNLGDVGLSDTNPESNGLDANGLENSGLGMDAQPNLEEDTLAGVSWAESGRGDTDLDLGGLELGNEEALADGAADPEVDDLALDAIGDFDSGMWDEASAETAGVQADESPAKVTRSLESLFSADDGNTPSAEGESGSGDPLSALFSDTSLDDIPSDSAAGGDSQETLAANPFEIDDLENDPFADLMLDDPSS